MTENSGQSSQAWTTRLEHILEDNFSHLIREIEQRVSLDIGEAAAAAGYRSRRAASEELNQAMRRLRQCRSTEEVATWLVDSTSTFCGHAALFEVNGTRVQGIRERGFPLADAAAFEKLEASLDSAPAFAHAIQERDTVIAASSAAEVSPQVAAMLGHAPDEKVYLYPMTIEEKAVAILYATAREGEPVDSAALELLTQAAASVAQTLSPEYASTVRPAAAPELVGIDGVDMKAHDSAFQRDLRRLSLEARARWFARATVARMRLDQTAAVARGRAERNIYSSLRPQIDAARQRYQQDYLAVSPAIADYLHKELIGLAYDDASLLGPEYPGSLA